ncbi:MAG: hypothetical protein JXA83_09815, partial [Acidimicrobiales bacterium]|nr:hypothetical protein [Acidimicrobiales bacterium]
MADAETLTDAGVSEREAEVLALVAERATNAEIAARLFVSVRTVESHVSSLLRKLRVSDRRALARLADESARAASRGGAEAGAGPEARSAAGDRPDRGDDDEAHAGAPARPAGGARALPVPLTSFVGRAAEVAGLTAAVETHRLVTATGPGGVGKTRLATAVAAALASRRRDGAWFVDLMPVTDDALIATAVANTLGLGDVKGRDAEDVVMSYLADSDALVVLDNCEHLVAGAAVFVERLLSRCPQVSVLATSQARLMLPFEWVVPVPGLSLPDGEGEGDAVALFVERARQAGSTVGTDEERRRIGEVCRRLDGSALAIELAAARLPSLGLDGIERGLTQRLELLAGGPRVDERHQSLRSTIDWSYELLDPADQMLLRRLALFAGAFTVDAATAVAQDDGVDRTAVVQGLARLTEHSLLVASPGQATRYRMLDTIRQYGIDKMAATAPAGDGPTGTDVEGSSELAVVGRRHLAWSIDTMAVLDARADLPLAATLERPDDLASWRADFDHAADDARAALKRALHDPDLRSEALALATLLADTSFTRGLLVECQRRYEQSAEVAADERTAAEMMMRAGGAAAGRQVGADTLVRWRRAADIAVAAGDLGVAAYALARSAEMVLRGPGIFAEKPSRELYASLAAEAR